MKPLLLAALLLSAAGPSSSIHSHLLLKPNEQFVLGGDQRGAFRVAAQNTGPVPVEICEQRRSGELQTLAVLQPRRRARLSFGAGSTALLRNTAGQLATLELDVTGSLPHRMEMKPLGRDGRL